MKIAVNYINEEVYCRFVRYDENTLRLWITDNSWFKSIGWCPHKSMGGGECQDCGLVVEEYYDR